MFGTVPDWLVALFTGLSALFLWLSIRPKKPAFEIERGWAIAGDPLEATITVRNSNPDHVAIVREIWAEPRDIWDLRSEGQPITEKRIAPGQAAVFRCTIDSGQRGPSNSISTPTIHAVILSNRRTHKYKRAL